MEYSFTIAKSHPSLEGHFPGNPVVPGVVILDEVINIVLEIKPGLTVDGIPIVKFTHPLLPEQKVTIEVTEKNENLISFVCLHKEIKLVTGQLTLKSIA
ncbi:MAG: hypothetical protein OEW97_01295 [Gammaproteobacteria bacterium]|nr:hypothetical protein [Gammaproteobacteria bacterium]